MRYTDRVEVSGQDATGAVLTEDFWSGGEAPSTEAAFLLGTVPVDAVPEDVLTRVATLS